jgi:glycosyltransferase A (GT-A) superfamily protein (DUF2064 family)
MVEGLGHFELCLLCRDMRPDANKTRLGRHLGSEGALRALRAIHRRALEALQPLRAVGGRVVIACSTDRGPEEVTPGFAHVAGLHDGFRFVSLGLTEAFADLFGTLPDGGARAMLVGDCPFAELPLVEEVSRQLENADCAICPAPDGGFSLLATRRPLDPGLWSRVRWSTTETLADLRAVLEGAGLVCDMGRVLADIDTVEDLRRYWPQLARELEEQGLEAQP